MLLTDTRDLHNKARENGAGVDDTQLEVGLSYFGAT